MTHKPGGSASRCCQIAIPTTTAPKTATAGHAKKENPRNGGGNEPPVATFTATASSTDNSPDAMARNTSRARRIAPPHPVPPAGYGTALKHPCGPDRAHKITFLPRRARQKRDRRKY
ncbi:hypothetical protein GCM10023170_097150 [Phytohabitans houttuyneae]|uniref:Uncharacterized protein n=1 Tax=Phytohabitans houttuyneae TaxID=1076126 RepID=A0A6V8K4Z1_9ACTN|nr:hypothetical protein Phou_015680 [Phytohabitans houttuyneae]